MRVRRLRSALACLVLVSAAAACDPAAPESADPAPAPPPMQTALEQVPPATPIPEATATAVPRLP